MENAILAENTVIQGVEFKFGEQIEFYAPNKVLYGTLGKDQMIQGVSYKESTSIWFHRENGTVWIGTLAENSTNLFPSVSFSDNVLNKKFDKIGLTALLSMIEIIFCRAFLSNSLFISISIVSL